MKARLFAALSVPLILAACGEGPTAPVDDREVPPAPIAVVTVTSPIGPVLAPGATGQLTATAVDTRGATVAATFTWSSSDEAVATVSAAGVVTIVGAGEVALRAETAGVSGSVDLTSVEAELDAVAALLDDPFAVGLLAASGDGSLAASWATCAQAIDDADLSALTSCLANVEAALAQGDDLSAPVRSLLTLFTQSMGRIPNATAGV